MKKWFGRMALVILTSSVWGTAEELVIDSIENNGSISFSGAPTGTFMYVEWAASLTDPGRTNWHTLKPVFVSSNTTTSDIPMFFRIRNIPFLEEAVGVWHFDGNVDDSIGTNNGTWFGTPGYTNDVVMGTQSIHADQFNEINISPASISTTSLTVNLWFKLDSTQGFGNPAPFFFGNEASGDALYVHLTTSLGKSPYRQVAIGNWIDYTDASGTEVWEYNKWHMLTVVRTSNVKVYIDGHVMVTQTDPAPIDSQKFYINGFGSLHRMDGNLDELSIWNRGLSDPEIEQLYIMQRGN